MGRKKAKLLFASTVNAQIGYTHTHTHTHAPARGHTNTCAPAERTDESRALRSLQDHAATVDQKIAHLVVVCRQGYQQGVP